MQRILQSKMPFRLYLALALIIILVTIPMLGAVLATRSVRAVQTGSLSMARPQRATSLFGPATGKHAQQIRPASMLAGRQLPGMAGHAAARAGRVALTSRVVHPRSALAANVVVSSDSAPPPFGPQPRNGPQAALDPTDANHIVVVYNDYTPNAQGGISTAGYVVSNDGGAHWSTPQVVHGLLKTDAGAYDGAADPSIVFDSAGNAYLAVATFNTSDWSTAIYIAKMPVASTSFGAPARVAAFNDTQHVVEFARITAGASSLYLTFSMLSATPQAPNSALAASWTARLYFAASTTGGQTWAAPLAIGAGPQDYWGVPVTDWNGGIDVFYSGNLGLQMAQSSNGGLTWSSPRSLAPINTVGEQRALNDLYVNPGPDAAVDTGSRTLYVVFDGGKFIMSSDGGATWSQPIDVLGNRFTPAFLASIAVDAQTHTVSIGGYSTASDSSQNTFGYYYAQSADGGNHFSSPALASANASLPPAPAFGSIGRVSSIASGGHFAHLFWTDTNGANGNEQIITSAIDVSQPMAGALQNSWDSTQTLPPWGLVFTASGSQTIGVGNYGQGSIGSVTATPCGGCSWLNASASQVAGNWVVTVTATSGGSNVNGTVTINAAGLNSSLSIPVQLLVTSPTPAFAPGANSLTFTTPQGIDPATQAVQVSSLSASSDMVQVNTNNDAVLNAYFTNGAPTITLSPGGPSGLIVLVDVTGLSAGTSTHNLTVSDGATTLTLSISLTITTAPAQLSDPGSSLSFSYHEQDASPPPAQSITLDNVGGSTLHWQARADVSWLSLGSASGTLNTGSSQQVSVSVNVAGQQPGTFIGHILIGGDTQALNLPRALPVYLVILPPANAISKTWYFAEGYVSANFSEFLSLENPNTQPATVSATYLTQPVGQPPKAPFTLKYTVNANTRYTVPINSQPGITQNDQVSLIVNSSLPIVAERPMYFKYTQLTPNPSGGSDVLGATHLSSIFFFPFVELGSDAQSGSPTFGTNYISYLTVLNQNSAPVNVSISYRGAGSLYTVTHQVAANTRGTVNLAADFPLAFAGNFSSYLYAVSLLVTTDRPVVVELPSYFTIPGASSLLTFNSGTDEIGTGAPQNSWDFAEGYSGSQNAPFLTYIDLANYGDSTAQVTLTLSVTGANNSFTLKTYTTTIDPQSSVSVLLNPLICSPANPYCGNSVGTHVSSSLPIVADRQKFFHYNSQISGATAVVGSAAGPQSLFYFAEGYTGAGFSEYLTFVNPATSSGNESVTIRYLIQGGAPKTITLPSLQPGQRWTENVNNDVGANRPVAVVVTASAGTLMVERPMYFAYRGIAFGGSDVVGYTPGE